MELNNSLRILFAGTPAIAVPTLEALAASGAVVAVLTNPDRPGARGKALVPSPVKEAALKLGLPVLQPETLRTQAREIVASYKPDVLVCFAYGRLFGPRFLELFPQGALNIHPSLLPRARGSSPIQETVLSGDKEGGISIQKIALEMDCGDILAVDRFTLTGKETTQSLTEEVARRAAALATSCFADFQTALTQASPQVGEPTYSHLITKAEAQLDWSLPAAEVHCRIRAYYPWPKAWTSWEGTQLFITGVSQSLWEQKDSPEALPAGVQPGTVVEVRRGKGIAIACSDALLWIASLQLAGRKDLDWQAFLNGNPRFIGSRLGG